MSAQQVSDTDTDAAVAGAPRSNGELIFDQPWQSRAFGVAAAAVGRDIFTWSEFQRFLIAAVSERDAAKTQPSTGEPSGYYSCWLAALERLLADKRCADADELAARAQSYAARPHGHDH